VIGLADPGLSVLGAFRQACRYCSLNELCWPIGLNLAELRRLQSIVRHTTSLSPGSHLFRVDASSTAIYAVRSGCIKCYSLDAGGHELVYGFHVRGEILGFDAVYPDRHRCNAVVLETCSACVIPYFDIDRIGREFPAVHSHVLQLMSRGFARQLTHGEGIGATQRIAAFLLDICSRLQHPGTVEYEFRLPMSREDIASYLGVSPETLSRLLAKLHRKKLISVDRRQIRLLDPQRLDLIAQGIG
jgi:CRP/FNR family transcriptional regulator